MWDFIFGFIPEKRQAGALSVLAFFSITLPIVAAITALAAWKLNDRLSRHRHPAESPAHPALPSVTSSATVPVPAAATDAEARTALIATENVLHETQTALHETEAELEHVRANARSAVALATQRRITSSQRQRFLKVSAARPKGYVGLSAIEGDSESIAYAGQIHDLLVDAGYEVGNDLGYIQIRDNPLIGLRVGAFSKDTAPPHALPLAASFIDSDIAAFPVINQKVPTGQVEVTVGTNPAAIRDDPLPEIVPADPLKEVATPPPVGLEKPEATLPPSAPEMPVATPLPISHQKGEKVVAPKRGKE